MLQMFEICFWTGVIFTTVSFVLGQFFDCIDFDTEFDFLGLPVSPLKPVLMAAFVTVFGGVGMISMERGVEGVVSIGIALFFAFLAGALFYRYIIVPLYKAENTGAISQEELIGHLAKISIGIKGKGFGKISYTVNGNIYTAPAKSIEEIDIAVGTEVVIIEIKNNIFYVAIFT